MLEGPDQGVHFMLSIPLYVLYIISNLRFLAKYLLPYRYLESKIFGKIHPNLMEFFAKIGIVSGSQSYLVMLYSAAKYDIAHIYDVPVNSFYQNVMLETTVVYICGLSFIFLVSFCVGVNYYQHHLVRHHGIITYRKFKNKFKELCSGSP